MQIDLITKQDMYQFQEEMLIEIKSILKSGDPLDNKWLRSSGV